MEEKEHYHLLTMELHRILGSMELPSFRTQNMNSTNLMWLQRNIMIQNGEHPEITRANEIIRKLLSSSSQ